MVSSSGRGRSGTAVKNGVRGGRGDDEVATVAREGHRSAGASLRPPTADYVERRAEGGIGTGGGVRSESNAGGSGADANSC